MYVNILGCIVNFSIYRCVPMIDSSRDDMVSVNYKIKYIYNYKLQ